MSSSLYTYARIAHIHKPQTIEASHALFGSPSVYVSTSPSLYSHFNVDSSKAVILALKDHDLETPSAWYTLEHPAGSTEALAKWVSYIPFSQSSLC